MRRYAGKAAAALLVLAMVPTTVFGAEISVSSRTAKQDTNMPFQVVLNANSADILQPGAMTVSLEEGMFLSADVKATLGAKDLKPQLVVTEKSIVITLAEDDIALVKGGDKINISGIVDVDGLGEKKLTVDANTVGLGKDTKVFAVMTEEDASFAKVLNKVPSVGYQRDTELAHFMVSLKSGEEVTLTLPSGVEWDSTEMKKAERVSEATVVSVDGRKLVLKATSNKAVIVKPLVDIDDSAAQDSIELEIKAPSNSAKLVVGKVEEYKPVLEVQNGVKTEFAGKKDISVVVVLKSTGGKLPQTSYVDFKVVGGTVKGEAIDAKEVADKAKIQDKKGNPVDDFSFRTNDQGGTMKLDLKVTPDEDADVVVLEAKLRNADLKTELVKVSPRVGLSVDKKNISGGIVNEEVGNVVIEEKKTKALESSEIYGIKVAGGKFDKVLFGKDVKVDAEKVTVKDAKLGKDEDVVQFTLNRASSGSDMGKITISALKVTTQRTIPNGNYKVVFFKAVKPSKELDSVILADGKEYGMEPIAKEDFFTIGAAPVVPTPVPQPQPQPQPVPQVQTKTVFTLGSNKYMVGDAEKQMTSAVYTKDGYTMLPMRVVAETIGVQVAWDSASKTATFTKGDTVVKVKSNGKTLNKNGVDIKMNTASQNVKGSLFLPLSSLGDAFGLERGTGYVWVPATKQVIVMH